MTCPYKKCKLGCSNITKHKALYAIMNVNVIIKKTKVSKKSPEKVSKKSSKIDYEKLKAINNMNSVVVSAV